MTQESTPTAGAAVAEPSFDLRSSPIPSFGALQQSRAEIFRGRQALESFRNRLGTLDTGGDEGRRRGLGLWMAGDYAAAVEQLAQHAGDHVAAFTLARAHMSLGQPAQALPIFERLAQAYPQEPRPRAGVLEARMEVELAAGDESAAAAVLGRGLAQAYPGFSATAEGRHLTGRMCELNHEPEAAVEHYRAARELDPTHRTNLFRLGYLAERCGLDGLALETYRSLVSLLPVDSATLVNLGVLYEDLGRDQDAAVCYDTIVRSRPTDLRARLYLEDAHSGMDMFYDEDMERKEDKLNQLLRVPITDFELSVRARNCLNKMDITTLGDLVRLNEAELLGYKNFGETSLNEIKEILASKGLRLGMAREEAVASMETGRRRHGAGEDSELLDRPISALELSIRARRTVEALNCLTLGDVVQHSEEELLGMPNFGTTSLLELKGKLAELGLKLKPKAG